MPHTSSSITSDALPGGTDEQRRRQEALRRRRMLSGAWLQDLEERTLAHFGSNRKAALGCLSLSRNMARSVQVQRSKLYDSAPSVGVDSGDSTEPADDSEAFLKAVDTAGLWQMGTRLQQRVGFIQEGLRRVTATGPVGARSLQFRNVWADEVYVEAKADEPDVAALVIELRPRLLTVNGDIKVTPTWDVLDVRDPDNPQYRVVRAKSLKDGQDWTAALEDGGDLSAQFLSSPGNPEGDLNGANYPYRYDDGTPFNPYELYHAARTGQMWDPWEMIEMADATLDVASLWGFWFHVVKDTSWPQRYVLNAILRGANVITNSGDNSSMSAVDADPAVLLQFLAKSTDQVQFGQWEPGGDPERLEMAISSFESATLTSLGLAPGDLQVSGGAKSGVAIELDRSVVRDMQKRDAPQFSRGDASTLAKAAAIANREGIFSGLPESGYTVSYPPISMSRSEREAAKQEIDTMVAAGAKPSTIFVVQTMRQVDRATAIGLVRQWKQDDKELASIEAEAEATADVPTADPPAAALNGAQVNAALEVARAFKAGELDRPAAIAILVSMFGLPLTVAEEIIPQQAGPSAADLARRVLEQQTTEDRA